MNDKKITHECAEWLRAYTAASRQLCGYMCEVSNADIEYDGDFERFDMEHVVKLAASIELVRSLIDGVEIGPTERWHAIESLARDSMRDKATPQGEQ